MQQTRRGRAQLSLDSPLAAVLAALAAVVLSTLLIYPLRQVADAESLGVFYLLGVLVVSIYYGLWPGLLTALGSVLAFNLFHIPPTGRLEVAKSEDWVALGVFLIAALLASSIAEQSRARAREAEQRRQEADLMALLATDLLGGGSPPQTLGSAGDRLARAVGLSWAQIASGPVEREDAVSLPLERDGMRVGALLVPRDTEEGMVERLRTRILPALTPLLAAAVDRERLTSASVEARALRRSDELKTSILRAVSHDLRSPITAIRTAGEALESENLEHADRRQLAASVSSEAERLAGLVDKLLDLSRLEAGHAQPRRDWCSIEELVGV
ncbi:MAG TPA: DUF4118 domain-containing protein, partial [Gemmatimonadales bacterium]|nr:DUF4118 domain-containing protein [Gemmatimonadales bacterium]